MIEMPSRWQKTALHVVKRLRDLALTVLAFGSAQLLLSFLVWRALFRSYPQGFSMTLTLAGFGGWFIAFASSVGARRAYLRQTTARPGAPQPPPAGAPGVTVPLAARFQEQMGRFGCGTVIFLSSLLLLALAFALRVQADMQSGKTWNDIFPTMP